MPKALIRRKAPVLPLSGRNASASKSLLWMMVALFAGLAVLMGMGLVVASRTVRSMGLSSASARDSIHTPGGTFRLEQETQVGPGLPVYPRASLIVPDDHGAVAAAKLAQKGIDVSLYQSSESRELIDGWYMKHLSPEFTRHDPGTQLTGSPYSDAQLSDNDIVFVAERDDKVRVVALSENPNGTKISLIRFNKSTASGGPPAGSSTAPTAAPDASSSGPTQ